MDDLADAHFRQRFSGRYWQISANGKSLLRSRSLGDAELDAGSLPAHKNGAWRQPSRWPRQAQLYAAVRRVILEPVVAGQPMAEYLLIAAMDVAEIRALDALNGQLRGDVLAALGTLSLLLIAAAWLQVYFGLRPLELLRKGLENIRAGRASAAVGRGSVGGAAAGRQPTVCSGQAGKGDRRRGLGPGPVIWLTG